uniref:Uncharacterized protein n=1 Tax=Arundo donax TaxID=35708 RepID=A0A0A9EZD7_ARUDO
MGMMQRLISSMGKEEAMGKKGHLRGSGLVHQRGGVRGRRICPQHRSGQRGGIEMNGTWTERGIMIMTERGKEIMTGRETETETERGTERGTGIERETGTGMTEIAMVIITGTGIVIQSAMRSGTGGGHLGYAAGRGRPAILSVGG